MKNRLYNAFLNTMTILGLYTFISVILSFFVPNNIIDLSFNNFKRIGIILGLLYFFAYLIKKDMPKISHR